MPTAAGLPYLALVPEKAGYAAQFAPSEFLSVRLRGGLSRHRRDLLSSAAPITFRWRLNVKEYNYFLAFYRTTISGGSQFFLVKALLENSSVTRHIAHFVGAWRLASQSGDEYVIESDVEVIPFNGGESAVDDAARVAAFVLAASKGLVLDMPFTTRDFDDYSLFNAGVSLTNTVLGVSVIGGLRSYFNDFDGDAFLNLTWNGTGTGNYTKSCWISHLGSANDQQLLSDLVSAERFGLNNTGQLFMAHNASAHVSPTVIATSTRTHVAVTWDNAVQVSRLYLNGALNATSTPGFVDAKPNSGNGCDAFGCPASSSSFHGAAIHLEARNFKMTDGEVQTLYQAQLADANAYL